MPKSKIQYCTYFNKNYLVKGLALHASLIRHNPSAVLDILCMDQYTKIMLDELDLKGVTTILLSDFEDKDLKNAKKNRSVVEYYWTCTPSLPRYVMKKNPKAELVCYLDADLYFYDSSDLILKELGNNSIFIVEHRYPKNQKFRDYTSGKFNVAVNIFRNDREGKACLERWRAQCNEWCYIKKEKGRYGDQFYLNEWPKKYKRLTISNNFGVNTAPWNVALYKISKVKNKIMIGDDKLIIYHFHQLEYSGPKRYNHTQGYQLSKSTIKLIYKPYIKELNKQLIKIKKIDPDFKVIPIKRDLVLEIKNIILNYTKQLYWKLKSI